VGQLRRAVSAGRLIRHQRGVLGLPVPAVEPHGPDRQQDIAAALLTASPKAVVSHASAAELHELWTPSRRDGHVHLTVPGAPDDVRHGVRIHGSGLPAQFVERLHGVPVTTVARTAVDVARGRDLPSALVVLDSAVRKVASGGDAPGRLRDVARRRLAMETALPILRTAYLSVYGWPGSVAVRDALPLVEAGSESPFESWSRGQMLMNSVPPPSVGVPVLGKSGQLYWCDFGWLEKGLVGEADGLSKYGDTTTDVRASLAAERHRQRDIEDAGWRFVRWDTRELVDTWIARVLRTLRM
jgi:hypothetical protein